MKELEFLARKLPFLGNQFLRVEMCSVINDRLHLWLFGGGTLELPLKNLELPQGRFATKSSLYHHFAHVIYNRTLPIIEDWFPRNSNFLGRNCQFSLREPYVLNLYFTLKIFNSEPKVVNIKMSNHHSVVGSEKTKNYEIIKSHGVIHTMHLVLGQLLSIIL